MKACTKCSVEKPLSEYYAMSANRDGHFNECKECTKKRVIKHRRDNSEAVRAYDRRRYQTPERKARGIRNAKVWRQQNPVAYKAQTAVGNAVRDGRLKKEPCLFCGVTERVHAHHKDYTKPLEVLWLCPKCHHRLHANFPDHHGHHHQEV